MKLVLTSGGISNKSIEIELKNFLNKNFQDLKMLFYLTASNYEGGVMNDWLIKDIIYFKNLGFQIDICDINGVNIANFLPRFKWADVFYFAGGNTQWLRKCIKTSGLESHLDYLLKTRVWIGSSAGSCVLCPTLCNSCQDLFDENIDGFPTDGLNLVNFQFIPHLNNEFIPKINKENLLKASKYLTEKDGEKLYAMDDNGAIFIDNDTIKIVSEGEWFEV